MKIDLTNTSVSEEQLYKELLRWDVLPCIRVLYRLILLVAAAIFVFCSRGLFAMVRNKPLTIAEMIVLIIFLFCFILYIKPLDGDAFMEQWLTGIKANNKQIKNDQCIFSEERIELDALPSYPYAQLRKFKISDTAVMLRLERHLVALPCDCFTKEELSAVELLLRTKMKKGRLEV